ncbi:guanylate kinase [Buchnera aphidicola]|uniref:guanylate kinase n=1 Tax=Buchnera aphidicola TaxID=9 RepID=UPI002238D8E4|nr:guanylate kinase [Buchnera aphidicola]MCW5197553.1 guanylate kinase [Buchnera aphidicola (Chaitophorus viminalis)]
MKKSGTLFIISAPSGTGKSSLIKSFINQEKSLNMNISISFTTRDIRSQEINGVDYNFISKKKFKLMIYKRKFLEYAKIFNHYYGTSLKDINLLLSKGKNIFLDIDWQGAQQIKKKISNVKSIFLLPPSKKELFLRLKKRNQDNKQVILNRMKNFSKEIKHYLEYDYLIINDKFNLALSHLKSIITSCKLSIYYQNIKYKDLINNLLKK